MLQFRVLIVKFKIRNDIMSINYDQLNIKGKLVVQADRKLKFLMGPIKSYYGINNISIVMNYAKYYKKLETKNNQILYQSRDGKSISDSPYAIFKFLLSHPKYKNFKHVWALSSNELKEYYKNKYKNYENIQFVVIHDNEYLKELAQSKYLINNSSFSIYFTSKPDQVYINTWHGTPLKHLGLDLENSLSAIQNLTRNFLHSKYILSQNKHTTEIFKRAFQLQGLYDGDFLEEGYPRTDLTINTVRKDMEKEINQTSIKLSKEKNLLFAPTYRGDFMNPSDDIDELIYNVEMLKQNTKYNILLKVHPFLYDKVAKDSRLKQYLVPDMIDSNEILCMIDLLVTDYSSIFFDFLVTNNPIIFYTSDYKKYKNERGLYLDVDSLPGPTTTNIEELIHNINTESFNEEVYKERYQYFIDKYIPNDDGNVTKRLVEKIFEEKFTETQVREKEKILIYAGGLMNNGITSSLLNLLNNIDYDRFDITIFLQKTNKKIALDNLNQVNNNVNIIFRSGAFFATFMENYRNNYVKKRGIISKKEEKIFPEKAYKREFRRIFGNSVFDYVIDFSGYSMFWANLLLATNSKKKFIYLHSDMASDLLKEVGKVRPHIINLKSLMTIYPKFDKLVNVSESIHRINKEKLKDLKINNKFTTVSNLLDLNKIYEKAEKEENIIKTNEPDKYLIVANSNSKTEIVNLNQNNFNIMASGRLSPEKGFDNLIIAFSYIAKQYPKAMLYILGEGKERTKLESMIYEKGLSHRIHLLGHQSNPFSLINKADLFVLSSHYEGQGLVLLECMALNKNILSTDLEVTRDILGDNEYGMLKNNDPESLAEGIKVFLENKQPLYKTFDIKKYNNSAVNQFNSLF